MVRRSGWGLGAGPGLPARGTDDHAGSAGTRSLKIPSFPGHGRRLAARAESQVFSSKKLSAARVVTISIVTAKACSFGVGAPERWRPGCPWAETCLQVRRHGPPLHRGDLDEDSSTIHDRGLTGHVGVAHERQVRFRDILRFADASDRQFGRHCTKDLVPRIGRHPRP